MRRLYALLLHAENVIHHQLVAHSVAVLRVAVGAVFLGFGVLKYFPGISPAEGLTRATTHLLTFGLIPGAVSLVAIATLECFIGACLITGRLMRAAIWLLAIEFVGILAPLALLPDRLFSGPHNAPTLEGQYVLKDMILVGAGMVIAAATFRGGRLVRSDLPPVSRPVPKDRWMASRSWAWCSIVAGTPSSYARSASDTACLSQSSRTGATSRERAPRTPWTGPRCPPAGETRVPSEQRKRAQLIAGRAKVRHSAPIPPSRVCPPHAPRPPRGLVREGQRDGTVRTPGNVERVQPADDGVQRVEHRQLKASPKDVAGVGARSQTEASPNALPGRTQGKSCRLIGALLGLDPGSDAAHRHVDALLPGMLRHFPPGHRQQPTRSPVAIRCLTRTARTSWR